MRKKPRSKRPRSPEMQEFLERLIAEAYYRLAIKDIIKPKKKDDKKD